MRYETNDKFDRLLDTAVSESGRKDVELFESLDDSDVKLSKGLNRSVRRLAEREKRKSVYGINTHFFIRVAVAVAVLLSMMITLIACEPTFRNALIQDVIDWQESDNVFTVTDEGELKLEKIDKNKIALLCKATNFSKNGKMLLDFTSLSDYIL